MPKKTTRTRKHAKRKREEDKDEKRHEQATIIPLQALLPVCYVHEISRMYTRQTRKKEANANESTYNDACNEMKLVNVNVTYSDFNKGQQNETNEVKTKEAERKNVVFAPDSKRPARHSRLLPPKPPTMKVVDNVILCSPCSTAPSYHEQDSIFTLNSKSCSPLNKGRNQSCTQKSKVRLSFFDRIKEMSKTFQNQQPKRKEKVPRETEDATIETSEPLLNAKIKALESELHAKMCEIDFLKKKERNAQQENSYLRQDRVKKQVRLEDSMKQQERKKERTITVPNLPKSASNSERDATFKKVVENAAKLCYPYARRSTKTKKLLDLLESGSLFNSESFMTTWKGNVAKKLTRATFSPPLVLQAIDSSDEGGWNISGAACYRNIQQLNKYERGFLFSKGPIIRAAQDLEREARTIVDFKLVKEEGQSERVEYTDFAKIIAEDIKAHGLEHKALTNGVEIGASSDGADFSRSRGHTSTGWRILDIDAKVPGTDNLLFDDGTDELDRKKLKNYHSKDICHFLCMSQCKETKKHYHEHTRHIFDFLVDASKNGIQHEGKTYRVNMCFPADQSCHWKVLGMGGACKVANMFCHLCGCTSQECARYKTGSNRCTRCIRNNADQCYHHHLDTEEEIIRKKEKIALLKEKYTYLSNLDDNLSGPFFSSNVTQMT